MQRTPVRSKAIAAVGYNPQLLTLEVEFSSGRVFQYRGVQPELHAWLLRAPSKGGILNRLILGKFAETEVTPALSNSSLASLLSKSLEKYEPTSDPSEPSEPEGTT